MGSRIFKFCTVVLLFYTGLSFEDTIYSVTWRTLIKYCELLFLVGRLQSERRKSRGEESIKDDPVFSLLGTDP